MSNFCIYGYAKELFLFNFAVGDCKLVVYG